MTASLCSTPEVVRLLGRGLGHLGCILLGAPTMCYPCPGACKR